MITCISPSDYNTDETLLALSYASRVKNITNEVILIIMFVMCQSSKHIETREIARMKKQIVMLQNKLDDMTKFDEIRAALTGPSSLETTPRSVKSPRSTPVKTSTVVPKSKSPHTLNNNKH